MKLLIWHCDRLESVDRAKSTRPPEIKQLVSEKQKAAFTNILAVFACIEKGDTKRETAEAVKSVIAILEMIDCNREVVIIPFAHLSANLANPKAAIELLKASQQLLKEAAIETHMISFGYHKDFELHFRSSGHPGSVSFRHFPETV